MKRGREFAQIFGARMQPDGVHSYSNHMRAEIHLTLLILHVVQLTRSSVSIFNLIGKLDWETRRSGPEISDAKTFFKINFFTIKISPFLIIFSGIVVKVFPLERFANQKPNLNGFYILNGCHDCRLEKSDGDGAVGWPWVYMPATSLVPPQLGL